MVFWYWMTEHAIIHSPEGVATACVTMPSCGACGWGGGTAVSNRDNRREQPIQQQEATERIAGSNREESRRQNVLS